MVRETARARESKESPSWRMRLSHLLANGERRYKPTLPPELFAALHDKDNKDSYQPILYSDLKEPTLHKDITGKAQQSDRLLLSDTIYDVQGEKVVTKSYRLKMWIDENTEDVTIPKTFKLKVRLDAVQQPKNKS